MGSAKEEYSFTNIMNPQTSSYKSYLVEGKPLQLKNENPFVTVVIKKDEFDVLTIVDKNTKEEESFLFNYIGNDGLHICLQKVLNDFFCGTSHQTLLIFKDFLNNGSSNFEKEMENEINKQLATYKIKHLNISISDIVCDIYTDFVSGKQTSLTEVDFTYFVSNTVNIREKLKLFKARARSGWQAFIIRIRHCYIEKVCNIIFLNPELCNSNEGENIVPVNRSLTAILNCHYEPQLNCGFTNFIYTLTNDSNVSVVVQYPTQEINFMNVKTILFHSCFKYVSLSDPKEIADSKKKMWEYIKKLESKVHKIEKETRAKLVKELSDFYFQQYCVLKENYAKALSQMGSSRQIPENMENASIIFNHSIAVKNFTEVGDCSSRLKGLVYLMYETQRQFKCLIKMNSELVKNKNDFEKSVENDESLKSLKIEVGNLKKEKSHLLRTIEVKDMEMAEQKQKSYRVAKHCQRAIKFYQSKHAMDQDIIKANRKEVHSLLRYINQTRRKESVRISKNLRKIPPCSRPISLEYPVATKSCILERKFCSSGEEEKVKVLPVDELPFARIRVHL